ARRPGLGSRPVPRSSRGRWRASRGRIRNSQGPARSATQADLDAQFALRMRIRDKLTEVHEAINGIRALRTQVEGWEKRAEGSAGARVRRGASSLKTKIAAVEEELIQVKAKSRQDTLNYPAKLNLKI